MAASCRRGFFHLTIILLIFLHFIGVSRSHSHSHQHGGDHGHAHSHGGHGHAHEFHDEEIMDEPASYKYSQRANEKVVEPVEENVEEPFDDIPPGATIETDPDDPYTETIIAPLKRTQIEIDPDDPYTETITAPLKDTNLELEDVVMEEPTFEVEPEEGEPPIPEPVVSKGDSHSDDSKTTSPESHKYPDSNINEKIQVDEGQKHSHELHGHSHDHREDTHDHHEDTHDHHEATHDHHEKTHDHHEDTHGHHGHTHDHHGHSHDHHGHSHDHEGHSSDHQGHAHKTTDDGHPHGKPLTPEPSPRKTTTPITAKKSASTQPQDTFMLWVTALGSTAMISCAPVLILLFIPLDNTSEKQPLLRVLLSFASGGLLGDAFLHLIPHALTPHSHDEEHSHSHSHEHGHSHGNGQFHHDMFVGLWVLAGIVAFLCVEKFVRYVKGDHGHSHGGHSLDEKKHDDKQIVEKDGDAGFRQRKKTDSKKEGKQGKGSSSQVSSEIAVAGYLNLAADFSHNFTDGLAVGASYLVGHNLGIITTITILLHEVPHEIGDFAILVQSGCSKRKAMLLQFSTAIGAMAGTTCSLLAQGVGEAATSWILPFTAGGFIYIATVSVIPELLIESKPLQTCKEILALVIGVYMMVLIAEYE